MGHNDSSFFAKARSKAKANSVRRGPAEGDAEALAGFPALTRLLMRIDPDGPGQKLGGAVLIYWSDRGLTVRLTVPSSRLVAFRQAESLDTLFMRLEEALEADSVDWREESSKNGKKA